MQFQFSSFAEFLAMDGHGIYVWISYVVTFAALAALALYPRITRRRIQRELQRQQRIVQRRCKVNNERIAVVESA
ncbi:heme exporter protein CcmD [Microbulbifer spongiae]|uniref:Heme exporter protein D n=1 Tax=Microbulbifer spongiae TaxID=2944933 RepID=A0ABY9ED52_9GAMM|nr:heme exporter protein CcmD [Microbulbifer sp. MI-G]WKD50953.1 heme exporter protein CcmD [Microbulbifer sp. MI-G]